MTGFPSSAGPLIVRAMADAIHSNAALLSELDGAAGDGDHGINMDKGFTRAVERLQSTDDFSSSLGTLSTVLLDEIGGAMGPLYGSFFAKMARECRGQTTITGALWATMLEQGLSIIVSLGGAHVGDKTLVDVLDPAVRAFQSALTTGTFAGALEAMAAAAEEGKETAKNLVARIGRASRLGERSRGVYDAGSVSCFLLLQSMARSIQPLLNQGDARAV